jgi:hypothetical protein
MYQIPSPQIILFDRKELLRRILESGWEDQTGMEEVSNSNNQMLSAQESMMRWVCDTKVRGPGFAFFEALSRAYMIRSAQRRDLSCPLCLMPPTLSPLWRARKRPCCGRSPSWTTSGPVPSPRPRVAVATPVAIAIAHRIPVTDLIFA